MTQNSAPEAVGSTGIVDVPMGGRELPLNEFTDPDKANLPHNQAYALLSSNFLDVSVDDPDRPQQDKDHKETAAAYEERLLKGVEEALQPDVQDDISPEGLWARGKLLAIESGRPDSKDLAMAVNARRALRQQAQWEKEQASYKRKIEGEHYVAEHVFSDPNAGGVETARGKLSSIVSHTPEGPEITESVLLDTVAHSIARESLANIPDETITDLADLKGVKGVAEVRGILRDVARDVAFSGSEISYRSVRAELARRLTERDTSGGQLTAQEVPTGPLRLPLHSAERASLHRAQMMLDRQFDTTMLEALSRVRGMRGVDDLGSAPTPEHAEVSNSVLRAVAELKKIPQTPDGLQTFIRDHGMEDRILGRLRPHQKGESSRSQERNKRLMEKLALNFNDYALKGTDWIARMHSHSISSPKGPTQIGDMAFEQRSPGSSTSGKPDRAPVARARRATITSATAPTSAPTAEPTPTSVNKGPDGTKAGGMDPTSDGGGDEYTDQEEDDAVTGSAEQNGDNDNGEGRGNGDDGAPKNDDETSSGAENPDDAPGGDKPEEATNGDKPENETPDDDEAPPAAPGDQNGDDNGKEGGEDGTGGSSTDDTKDRPLHTSARVAFVSLKDAGADNIDNIARFVQNTTLEAGRDKRLAGLYKVPLIGGVAQALAHPVRTFWQGWVTKGNVDATHMVFAARMRNLAKNISGTDGSVHFELTEDVMAQALAGAKAMKASEGRFQRFGRFLRYDLGHILSGMTRTSEMARAEEWLQANGSELVKKQKETSLIEQTALAERFTLQGDDASVLSTQLGESRVHLDTTRTEHQAIYERANRDLKALIERYAKGEIANEDDFLHAVNEYVHGTLAGQLAGQLSDTDQSLLESSEFASNMLPVANEIKSRWAAYSADAKDGSGSAFSKFNLDITVGSGVWGGARAAEKGAKIDMFSFRDKLAHRLAEHPQGLGSGLYNTAYGTARDLVRIGALDYLGMYGMATGTHLLPLPVRAATRTAGILGIAAFAGAREGGMVMSNNGRLMGLGGKTQERVAQTSYEVARGRKSPDNAILMKEMEEFMVHRVKAEDLASAITGLSGKEQLSDDEAKVLLSAVAHAKARIMMTDQSVVRPSGARRMFDLAMPNNFIEFSEGGENRQYMALRKAIVDGQIALARGGQNAHLDDAIIVMQGQLARGNDKAAIQEWLVSQGKTEAEAQQLVTDRFTDLGIQEDQSMNNRMTALAKYSWRKFGAGATRALLFGGAVSGITYGVQEGLSHVPGAEAIIPGSTPMTPAEQQTIADQGEEVYQANWEDVRDGVVEPKNVLEFTTDDQGNAIVTSTLSPGQEAALLAHHNLGEVANSIQHGVNTITPGEFFDTEVHMQPPVDIDGVNISLPENVHHYTFTGADPSQSHEVIFDGRNGNVYDLTHAGYTLTTSDFDGDGQADLAVNDGQDTVAITEYADEPGELFHGFTFDTRDPEQGAITGPEYSVSGPCVAQVEFDGHTYETVIPAGSEWITDSEGNLDLVSASDHNLVFMQDVTFNAEGGIDTIGDGSMIDLTHVKNEPTTVSHSAEPTYAADGSINPNSEWAKNQIEVNHRSYFSENNSQLGVHTIKEGDALIISMQEVARRSDHIAERVAHGEHGFYFTLGGHGSEGLYVPAIDGIIKLDPNDHSDIQLFKPDGTPFTTTSADLYNLIVNRSAFEKLEDGNIATELYNRRDVFALDGGRFEAVLMGQNDNGELFHEIVATGKGSAPANEFQPYEIKTETAHIEFTSRTNRIFEMTPPLRLPEDTPGVEGSPASVEFRYFPVPALIGKERSVTGENVGKVNNIPQGVSFDGGTVVDSPLPKPKDNSGGGTGGTGTGAGEDESTGKEDESGGEQGDDKKKEDESGKKEVNERIAELRVGFAEKLDAQLVEGKMTAEQLAAIDFAAAGLPDIQQLTVAEAQEILTNSEKRVDFVNGLWNSIMAHQIQAYTEASADPDIIAKLVADARQALIDEDPATSGLTENQRKLLNKELMDKFDAIDAETKSPDSELNTEAEFKKYIAKEVGGNEPTDGQMQRIMIFYRDMNKRVSEARQAQAQSGAEPNDTEIIRGLLLGSQANSYPQALIAGRNIARAGFVDTATGQLNEAGIVYMSNVFNALNKIDERIMLLTMQRTAEATGLDIAEMPELFEVDRNVLRLMIRDRATTMLMTREEFFEGLPERVAQVEAAFGVEVDTSGDASGGGDDGSGGAGGTGSAGTGDDDAEKGDDASGSETGGSSGSSETPKGPDTTGESGQILGSEQAQRVLESILRISGERSADQAAALIGRAKDFMVRESTAGVGKLGATITDMAAGKEAFVDGKIAFIPRGDGRLITVGDLHGDSATVEQILRQTGFIANMEDGPGNMRLVFMGDYVDRGPKSIRVMEMLMDLKVHYPNNIILMKADHEVEEGSVSPQQFPAEVRAKYGNRGDEMLNKYYDLYNTMPRMVVTANGVVIGHGGPVVSKEGRMPNLVQLRDGNPTFYKMLEWGDPAPDLTGYVEGNGDRIFSGDEEEAYSDGLIVYSPRALQSYLAHIGGKVFVRGHEDHWEKRFSHKQSPFHGKLMQVHSTGKGSPEETGRYRGNLATYGEFSLQDDINAIDYDRNQKLVWG